ncbi:hypothetical protein GCM10010448_32480 [Streptomyces glomeratus]|uniref:Uncharacterized protein n=1 Tax=Streptomyces glomeratus TaxID=284452 RepID=A0ABP6LK15_9ACTN
MARIRTRRADRVSLPGGRVTPLLTNRGPVLLPALRFTGMAESSTAARERSVAPGGGGRMADVTLGLVADRKKSGEGGDGQDNFPIPLLLEETVPAYGVLT